MMKSGRRFEKERTACRLTNESCPPGHRQGRRANPSLHPRSRERQPRGDGVWASSRAARLHVRHWCHEYRALPSTCRRSEVAQKQVSEIVHAQVNVGMHEPMLELVDELSATMPHKSLDTFYFCTTRAPKLWRMRSSWRAMQQRKVKHHCLPGWVPVAAVQDDDGHDNVEHNL